MVTIKTTVVGSYPVEVDTLFFMRDYFDNRKISSWNGYIRTAVNDMSKAGLDIISDGQTRDPFIQLFARGFEGCRVRDRVEVVDKIEYENPITVKDQLFVKSIIPKNILVKGVLTGPFTLSKSCVDIYYNDERKMAFDFALALKQEAEELEKHVDMISIDEPFFSNEMPEYTNELIEIITKGIRCPTILHACGDVSSIIPGLIEMPIDILSHEFKATPHLFERFKEYSFTQNICLGSVRSDDPDIESVDEIIKHVRKALDIFGDKVIQMSPDCGQRLLPRENAFQKLRNLVEAGERVNGR